MAVSRSSCISTGVSVYSDKGKPIMTVTQATDHIRTVASDNLIIIDEWEDANAEALRYPKDLQRAYGLLGEIHLPSLPLQTWRGYATALHELGISWTPSNSPTSTKTSTPRSVDSGICSVITASPLNLAHGNGQGAMHGCGIRRWMTPRITAS